MNNIFDIKRFGLVFRKDLMEGWKRYALLFLTMFGIMAIIITWNYFDYYDDIAQGYRSNYEKEILRYIPLLFGAFGLLFASTFMNPMNSKLKKITYLVSPSSNLEKYLTRWIIVTVVYIISFFIAMWFADAIRVAICSARYPDLDIAFIDLTKLINLNPNWDASYLFPYKWVFFLCVATYSLFQSLFILGSTFWEKTSFVKTFTVGASIVFLYVMICRWAILFFYGTFDKFANVLNSFDSAKRSNMNEDISLTITISVISAFTLINWTLAFFRFRESEIIKRL